MPGSIVHLIVQQRLPDYLKEFDAKEYANLLAANPCSPYSAFGSMGPDFLFFSLKEYGTPLDELINMIFKVYDSLRPLINFYEQYIEPVEDDINDAITAADQAFFEGIFTNLKKTASMAISTAEKAAEAVVTKKIDLFYPFQPKIQKGAPEDEWYWVDYLHYRRTGRFCSNMWSSAQGDKDLMRYCLGYASHIGTDVAGHPFVNAVVGGPYRMHWHRHKLVENWIDAYARNTFHDNKSIIKCLGITSKDTYLPNAISGSYYYRLCEFPKGTLPKKLGDLIIKSMNDTYHDIPHPTTFDFDDLDATYRLWLKWFEMATTIGNAIKPTPLPPPGSATLTLVKDYWNGLTKIWTSGGSSNGSGGGGSSSIWSFFAAIWKFLKNLAESIYYTIEYIITHSSEILTLPYTEALAVVNYLLNQIQIGIWTFYDDFRFMLVMGGYLYPEPEDLAKLPFGKAYINTANVQLVGGPSANYNQYPVRQEIHDLFGPMEHHFIYAATPLEMKNTEPAPPVFYGKDPEFFINGGFTYDPVIENLYSCKGPYGNSLQYTDFVNNATLSSGQFGSAIPYSARLIAGYMNNLPNLNLDADRGYGWKTWRAKDPKNINLNSQVDVDYID